MYFLNDLIKTEEVSEWDLYVSAIISRLAEKFWLWFSEKYLLHLSAAFNTLNDLTNFD